jgi:F-type H+-transporting ATPase subunit delta
MAEALTIARPYAEAAFKLASEAGELPHWSEVLQRLAGVVRSADVRAVIGNPRVSDEQVAGLIGEVAGNLNAEQRSFLRVLAGNERLAVLPEIAESFERLKNESEGVIDARIASAYPLFSAQVAEVVAVLEEKYGRKVKATISVDPDLIGGISIRIGDEVIDASVRGKLSQLADALMN